MWLFISLNRKKSRSWKLGTKIDIQVNHVFSISSSRSFFFIFNFSLSIFSSSFSVGILYHLPEDRTGKVVRE